MMSEAQPRKSPALIANSAFGVLAWLSPIVLGFISAPILVRSLGHENFGLYGIVLGFLVYSFAFGIGKIVAKYVAEYRASGDNEKIAEVVSATLWLTLLIGISGATVLSLLAGYIVSNVLLLPPALQDTARIALYIASVVAVTGMVSQIFQSAMQGIHRFGGFLLLTNLNAVLLSGGNIFLALSGFGVIALFIWNLVVVASVLLMFYLLARSHLPEMKIVTRVSSAIWHDVLRYAGSMVLYQLFGNILFIFERSWVTRKFGPEALTFYFVPMLLGIYLHGLIGSFGQVMFPRINELLNDKEQLSGLYRIATRVVMAVVIFVVVTYAASGKLFLSVWMGEEFALNSYRLLVIHGVTFGLIACIVITWNVAEAFKAAGLNAALTAAWMVISIPLMIVAAGRLGSDGIALSRLAGVALMTVPFIVYIERRFLGRIQARFWLDLFIRLLLGGVVVAAIQQFVAGWMSNGWLSLVTAIATSGVAFLALLLLSGFISRDEIAALSRLIRERKARETEG
jgi:O-antigen/teichoic acid export membrane protein